MDETPSGGSFSAALQPYMALASCEEDRGQGRKKIIALEANYEILLMWFCLENC